MASWPSVLLPALAKKEKKKEQILYRSKKKKISLLSFLLFVALVMLLLLLVLFLLLILNAAASSFSHLVIKHLFCRSIRRCETRKWHYSSYCKYSRTSNFGKAFGSLLLLQIVISGAHNQFLYLAHGAAFSKVELFLELLFPIFFMKSSVSSTTLTFIHSTPPR